MKKKTNFSKKARRKKNRVEKKNGELFISWSYDKRGAYSIRGEVSPSFKKSLLRNNAQNFSNGKDRIQRQKVLAKENIIFEDMKKKSTNATFQLAIRIYMSDGSLIFSSKNEVFAHFPLSFSAFQTDPAQIQEFS